MFPDNEKLQPSSLPNVCLSVIGTLTANQSLRNFPPGMTLNEFKKRSVLLTGSEVENIDAVAIYSKDDQLIEEIEGTVKDDMTLSELGLKSGMVVKIVDTKSSAIGLEDDAEALVSFHLPEEKYKQNSSWYKYSKEHGLGRFAPGTYEHVVGGGVDQLKIGQRCHVLRNGRVKPARAIVMFIGKTHVLPDTDLVGIRFDRPEGKHNGTVDGVKYFDCEDGHGCLVKLNVIRIRRDGLNSSISSSEEEDDESGPLEDGGPDII